MFVIKFKKPVDASGKYNFSSHYPSNTAPMLFNSERAAVRFAAELKKKQKDTHFNVQLLTAPEPAPRPDSPRPINRVTSRP